MRDAGDSRTLLGVHDGQARLSSRNDVRKVDRLLDLFLYPSQFFGRKANPPKIPDRNNLDAMRYIPEIVVQAKLGTFELHDSQRAVLRRRPFYVVPMLIET